MIDFILFVVPTLAFCGGLLKLVSIYQTEQETKILIQRIAAYRKRVESMSPSALCLSPLTSCVWLIDNFLFKRSEKVRVRFKLLALSAVLTGLSFAFNYSDTHDWGMPSSKDIMGEALALSETSTVEELEAREFILNRVDMISKWLTLRQMQIIHVVGVILITFLTVTIVLLLSLKLFKIAVKSLSNHLTPFNALSHLVMLSVASFFMLSLFYAIVAVSVIPPFYYLFDIYISIVIASPKVALLLVIVYGALSPFLLPAWIKTALILPLTPVALYLGCLAVGVVFQKLAPHTKNLLLRSLERSVEHKGGPYAFIIVLIGSAAVIISSLIEMIS